MKIFSGRFKSRTLLSPQSTTTRPTLAIMRQAVFNIAQEHIEGARFLDLYAGSGAMALEALSRGAAHATLVESHRSAFQIICKNVASLGVESECTLMSYDVFLALQKLSKQGEQFDLIYADPPYAAAAHHALLDSLLTFFDTHSLLAPGGRLFLEEAAPATLITQDKQWNCLRHLDTRQFSQSILHQFVATQ